MTTIQFFYSFRVCKRIKDSVLFLKTELRQSERNQAHFNIQILPKTWKQKQKKSFVIRMTM